MGRRISSTEEEVRAQRRAHTFMFGCGNGGISFCDPGDATETMSALSEQERLEQKNGFVTLYPFEQLIEQEELKEGLKELGMDEEDIKQELEEVGITKKRGTRGKLSKEGKRAKRIRYKQNKLARS